MITKIAIVCDSDCAAGDLAKCIAASWRTTVDPSKMGRVCIVNMESIFHSLVYKLFDTKTPVGSKEGARYLATLRENLGPLSMYHYGMQRLPEWSPEKENLIIYTDVRDGPLIEFLRKNNFQFYHLMRSVTFRQDTFAKSFPFIDRSDMKNFFQDVPLETKGLEEMRSLVTEDDRRTALLVVASIIAQAPSPAASQSI